MPSRIFHVDVRPSVDPKGKIRAQLTINYTPQSPTETKFHDSVRLSSTVLLDDGKKVMVSQSVDPRSDRRVSVEMMAKVVK